MNRNGGKMHEGIAIPPGSWIRVLAGEHIGCRGQVVEVSSDTVVAMIRRYSGKRIVEAALPLDHVRPTSSRGAH